MREQRVFERVFFRSVSRWRFPRLWPGRCRLPRGAALRGVLRHWILSIASRRPAVEAHAHQRLLPAHRRHAVCLAADGPPASSRASRVPLLASTAGRGRRLDLIVFQQRLDEGWTSRSVAVSSGSSPITAGRPPVSPTSTGTRQGIDTPRSRLVDPRRARRAGCARRARSDGRRDARRPTDIRALGRMPSRRRRSLRVAALSGAARPTRGAPPGEDRRRREQGRSRRA